MRPSNIPMHVFEREVEFYQLGEEALLGLHQEEGLIEDELKRDRDIDTNMVASSDFQQKMWELFEYPDSSLAAQIVSFWSMFVIGVSILIFCMETLPRYKIQPNEGTKMKTSVKSPMCATNEKSPNATFGSHSNHGAIQAQWYFNSIEMGCVIWFTCEYLLRLLSSPSKWKFLGSFLNLVDLLAILPYFVVLSISSGDATVLSVLRVARLIRVFRIFKLSRHSLSLKILGNTLKASVRELCMLMFFLAIGVLVFSSALYYAESKPLNRGTFSSIPDTFWYSLVTMTTVGYGDYVPSTVIGKLIGSLGTLTGVLTLALPVPVIVANFQHFNKRVKGLQAKRRDKETNLNEIEATNGHQA